MQPIHETLCLLVATGYLNQQLDEFEAMITPPNYLCTSCGRVAREEESLCLPRPIHICAGNPPQEGAVQ
ncbi:MAG: hypothetical protein DDG59_07645 [Anaerolineae bacterium]|jgi:hypothetical protein|nr:MAG: hypothetical protein DDG59_07645 [Anaerolineae bacterium]